MTDFLGVLVIFAKLSDIFGRKLMFITSISVFICFSAGCGAAQSLNQLCGIPTSRDITLEYRLM